MLETERIIMIRYECVVCMEGCSSRTAENWKHPWSFSAEQRYGRLSTYAAKVKLILCGMILGWVTDGHHWNTSLYADFLQQCGLNRQGYAASNCQCHPWWGGDKVIPEPLTPRGTQEPDDRVMGDMNTPFGSEWPRGNVKGNTKYNTRTLICRLIELHVQINPHS